MIVHKLASIRVLFREPYTLALWGIPYAMRPGQQPGDIWRAYQEYVPSAPRHYGSKRIDISDWLWLGLPSGWTSSLSAEDQKAIREFLTGKDVPGNAYEWCTVTEDAHA